jgi:hypothetical protein
MNEITVNQTEGSNLADALIYAIAYLSIPSENYDKNDDDCKALESVYCAIDRCSPAERRALTDAAKRGMATESSSLLVAAYNDILVDLNERFSETESD